MRHPCVLFALLLACLCWAMAWPAQGQPSDPDSLGTADPTSPYYHDFFDLPLHASPADSIRALHLPPPHPLRPDRNFLHDYVYFTGTILTIEPITQDRFPAMYEPESDRLYMRWVHAAIIRIQLTELLSGVFSNDVVEAVAANLRTPLTPDPFPYKTPIVHPGSEVAGLLLFNSRVQTQGLPILHGASVFVFSSPDATDNLDAFKDTVARLFRQSAADMEGAQ